MRSNKTKSTSGIKKVKEVKEQLTSDSILYQKGNGSIPVISDGDVSSNSKFDEYEDMIMGEHNSMVDEKTEEWDNKQKEVLEAMNKMKKDIEDLELKPYGNYLLVKPFSVNPFSRMTTLENGFVVPEFDPSFKDDGSGDMKEMLKMAEYAVVVDVPVNNKNDIFVQKDDIVYYQTPEALPIPFYNQGFKLVAVQSIKAIIGSKKKIDKRLNTAK